MTTAGPESCDLILRGAQVLTLDARRTVYSSGAVAVRGHTIAAVGPEAEVLRRWQAPRTLDAGGGIVHPGFVDAHLHINAHTCRASSAGTRARAAAAGRTTRTGKRRSSRRTSRRRPRWAASSSCATGTPCSSSRAPPSSPTRSPRPQRRRGSAARSPIPTCGMTPTLLDVIGGLKSDSLLARVPAERRVR